MELKRIPIGQYGECNFCKSEIITVSDAGVFSKPAYKELLQVKRSLMNGLCISICPECLEKIAEFSKPIIKDHKEWLKQQVPKKS